MSEYVDDEKFEKLRTIFEDRPSVDAGSKMQVSESVGVERMGCPAQGGRLIATERPLWVVWKDAEVEDIIDSSTFHSVRQLHFYLSAWEATGDGEAPPEEPEGRGFA